MTTTDHPVRDASQQDLIRRLSQYRSAVTPDVHSKAAYIGRVTQTEQVTIIADDGTAFEREVTFSISWASISKMLDIIEKRAEG